MRFSIIPFLLLIVPVVEIALFIVIGGQIGVLWTLAMILITAIIGSILLRVQGFQILASIRDKIDAGQMPAKELASGAMLLVAGILLLTPGFFTDTIGFLLFVPPVRSLVYNAIGAQLVTMDPKPFGGFADTSGHNRPDRGNDDVVDLEPEEFSRFDENDKKSISPDNKSPWRRSGEK